MDSKTNEFLTETDLAFRTAWHAEKGGDDNWNAFLSGYGIQPLTDEYKKSLLESPVKIARGAYPIELRRVYEKILDKYGMQAGSSAELAQAINSFDMEARIKEYYMKIKPFTGMGDIFKNAATGTQKYSSGLQGEKQKTMTCKNCGAPRLEEMQYDNCLFCGSKLFEIKNQ
ncbi:MAG: hypothetical protein LWX07_06140 [Bacteroidetes bacterium]|nr:hypothetical protein [Bacteroidota bacterium]